MSDCTKKERNEYERNEESYLRLTHEVPYSQTLKKQDLEGEGVAVDFVCKERGRKGKERGGHRERGPSPGPFLSWSDTILTEEY